MDPKTGTSRLAYEIIGDVKRVSPNPGDVIVIEHKLPLSPGDRVAVQQQFKKVFPKNDVVVMQAGMEIKIADSGK